LGDSPARKKGQETSHEHGGPVPGVSERAARGRGDLGLLAQALRAITPGTATELPGDWRAAGVGGQTGSVLCVEAAGPFGRATAARRLDVRTPRGTRRHAGRAQWGAGTPDVEQRIDDHPVLSRLSPPK